MFLSLFTFSRAILFLICKAVFTSFKLENDLSEIETSYNFFASFLNSCCTGKMILNWSKSYRPVKKFSTGKKNSRPVKKFSTGEKNSRPVKKILDR